MTRLMIPGVGRSVFGFTDNKYGSFIDGVIVFPSFVGMIVMITTATHAVCLPLLPFGYELRDFSSAFCRHYGSSVINLSGMFDPAICSIVFWDEK